MTEVLYAPGQGSSHFPGLRRSSSNNYLPTHPSNGYLPAQSSKKQYEHAEYESRHPSSLPSSAPSSPQFSHISFSSQPSFPSTPASSLSLDAKAEVEYDEDIMFPSYDGAEQYQSNNQLHDSYDDRPTSTTTEFDHPALRSRTGSTDMPTSAGDDQAIENEPTRHVDYLSHEWKEEDIWSSWRYVVARRNVYSNSVRLENASWRTWAKAKHHLKTVSPETLNWLKDCDVTWLYGPLQTDTKRPLTFDDPAPPSQLHPSSSFLTKKPILKKKSASEAMLQRSISAHSLLKHAGAILKAQEASPSKARPAFYRATSDFSAPVFSRSSTHNTPAVEETFTFPSSKASVTSSGLHSPGERRHIHFNNEVVQCIAVEGQGNEYDDEESAAYIRSDEDEDEGIVMMKKVPSKAKISNRSTPRGSFSNDGKTIAPLPSTTLKYRGDTPEPSESGTPRASGFWPMASKLSSPSQETLRPSKPSANFLLDDDDEDADIPWSPSTSRGYPMSSDTNSHNGESDDETDPGPGMHRTPSGMFMPYDEDEDEAAMNSTLFGKVVDTVNTARDIAHVIWNVGWRR